ncbi:hypothetical protein ACOYR1_06825 [Thalassotalea piscium]
MTLKVDLRRFLDGEGQVLELTEQAKMVFEFITKIVLSVSQNIEQPVIYVDVKCNSRAKSLVCQGHIEAKGTSTGLIEWYCDTCEASGEVSNWQASIWDRQKQTIH